MADGVTVEIKGLSQLAQTLERDLPEQLAKRTIRDAMNAGADVVAEAAESSAPVLSGELSEDIITKVKVENSRTGLRATAFIGPGYNASQLKTRKRGKYAGRPDSTTSPGVYGAFVEKGHAPPGKAGEKRKARRAGIDIEFGGKATPPHPWLAPAFQHAESAAVDAIVA